MDDRLLEPLKYYETQGRQEHHDNVEAYFNDLSQKSGVDIDANKETMNKWRAEQERIKDLAKALQKFKIFRVLLIVGIVIGAIMTLASFGIFGDSAESGALLLILGASAIVACSIALVKKVNPKIKNADALLQEHKLKAQNLENEGWEQMIPLNNLFSDYDVFRLVEKTLPDFKFEENFSKAQEKLFVDKYDFYDMQTEDSSMLDTVSGQYAGNPFVFGRRIVHRMGTHTYHGSLVITWTETYRDSNGDLRTRHRSQTLHASVVKPKPFYHTNTFLAYGNQAAPNLTFSRESNHVEDLSEKALERKIKRGERQLQKQAAKALKAGGNFQEMANSEFDVLFGATDRDNEVEFRLMYTPLAQRSVVALLKDSKNYGDDFDLYKYGKCNIVMSDHGQNWKMNIFASDYKHFDYEEIHSRFLNYNENYFKSIFFDFAPLFSVPAYLEEPCKSLEDEPTYNTNYTYYEHEVMSNAMGYERFVHEDSCTEAILKTQALSVAGERDIIAVTANSYTEIERIDYIPVRGGDGNYHNVPVPWIEYIPLTKTSCVCVGSISNPVSDAMVCYHGMSAGFSNV